MRSRVMRQALAAMALLCAAVLLRPAAAQAHDVSASYDHDGTLILDSRNFRGMTQQGIWVVMFYSYSVVIKSMDEAMICQRFTWLWGDLANRYSNMGGETRGGLLRVLCRSISWCSSTCQQRVITTVGFFR